MNDAERAELDWLRQRQEILQGQVSRLATDIQGLSARMTTASRSLTEMQPLEAPPIEMPPLAPDDSLFHGPAVEPVASETAMAPSLPPVIPARVIEPMSSESSSENFPGDQEANVRARERETFEMKLGTYWLVRVGIVMLLTGLVFL